MAWRSIGYFLHVSVFTYSSQIFSDHFASKPSRKQTMAYAAFRGFVSTRFPQIKFRTEAKSGSATAAGGETTLSIDVGKSNQDTTRVTLGI